MSRLTAHLLLTPLVHGRKSSLRLCRVAKPLNKWVVQSQWILKTGEERWTATLVCEPSSTSEGAIRGTYVSITQQSIELHLPVCTKISQPEICDFTQSIFTSLI
uniref:Uncharacterized protein n=1 Tax=Rhodnius prolixus TaxID=13249 RepID=T1HRX3_RHOPR